VPYFHKFPFKIKQHVKQFGQISQFWAEKARKLG